MNLFQHVRLHISSCLYGWDACASLCVAAYELSLCLCLFYYMWCFCMCACVFLHACMDDMHVQVYVSMNMRSACAFACFLTCDVLACVLAYIFMLVWMRSVCKSRCHCIWAQLVPLLVFLHVIHALSLCLCLFSYMWCFCMCACAYLHACMVEMRV